MNARVLVVDDDREMCRLIDDDLSQRGFIVSWYTDANTAFEAFRRESFDVVLTDLALPGLDGFGLCEKLLAERPDVPVVVITAFGSMDTAIGAIRAGAYDFVTKPFELDVLAIILNRAVQNRMLHEKVKVLSQALERTERFEDIIGNSEPMQALFRDLDRIANSEASVLISGESGTGKELVARAIHKKSRRFEGPFVPVSCAALPTELLESELFGHVRGAFTDAKTAHRGLFLQAVGGSLFLDEIGEISPLLQPKLLRVLEERKLRPVGGDREVDFDLRMISATNRDLLQAIDEGSFREDLYYRLNVIQVELPPLRTRGTDILLLAQHFIQKFSVRDQKQVDGMNDAVSEKLMDYSWPGNVRELRNVIERAVALARFQKLSLEDLPKKVREFRGEHLLSSGNNPMELVPLETVERRYILHVLQVANGNKSVAARILGLDRKTLYRKLDHYRETHTP